MIGHGHLPGNTCSDGDTCAPCCKPAALRTRQGQGSSPHTHTSHCVTQERPARAALPAAGTRPCPPVHAPSQRRSGRGCQTRPRPLPRCGPRCRVGAPGSRCPVSCSHGPHTRSARPTRAGDRSAGCDAQDLQLGCHVMSCQVCLWRLMATSATFCYCAWGRGWSCASICACLWPCLGMCGGKALHGYLCTRARAC